MCMCVLCVVCVYTQTGENRINIEWIGSAAEKKRNQKVCEGEERIKMFGFCSDHGRKLDAKEKRRGRQAFINYTTITLLYPSSLPPCLHVAAGVWRSSSLSGAPEVKRPRFVDFPTNPYYYWPFRRWWIITSFPFWKSFSQSSKLRQLGTERKRIGAHINISGRAGRDVIDPRRGIGGALPSVNLI